MATRSRPHAPAGIIETYHTFFTAVVLRLESMGQYTFQPKYHIGFLMGASYPVSFYEYIVGNWRVAAIGISIEPLHCI